MLVDKNKDREISLSLCLDGLGNVLIRDVPIEIAGHFEFVAGEGVFGQPDQVL